MRKKHQISEQGLKRLRAAGRRTGAKNRARGAAYMSRLGKLSRALAVERKRVEAELEAKRREIWVQLGLPLDKLKDQPAVPVFVGAVMKGASHESGQKRKGSVCRRD